MNGHLASFVGGLCLVSAAVVPAFAQAPAAAPAPAAPAQAQAAPGAAPAPAAAPPEDCNSLCRVVRTFAPPQAEAPPVEPSAKPVPVRKPRVVAKPAREARAPSGPVEIGLLADPDVTEAGPLADLEDALAPDIALAAVAGRASAAEDLLSLPDVDAAITTPLALAPAKRRADRLVYVAKLFTQELHLVAKPDVASLEDLAGRRVAVGPAGGASAAVAKAFLEARGIAVEAVEEPAAVSLAAVRAGTVAAVFVLAPKPFAPLAALAETDGLALVPLPPRAADRDFYPASLGRDAYPGLVPGQEKVETVAVDAVLVAPRWRERSPRQAELTAFARRLLERLPALAEAGHHPKWQEVNAAAEVAGLRRLRVAEDWVKAKLKQAARVGARTTVPPQRLGDIR